ncbi:MAG: hypothetical protein PHU14_00360 [Methylovulum sp.]|nr:hypothetical protein [Methylovulum sp.]
MRALIYFPIIHDHKDMGTLGDAAKQSRTEEQARKQEEAVGHFWTAIAAAIDNLGLDYARLKLYQDGLPVCGKENEIAAEVALAGSQNYQLLQTLQQKGATLMGTESPELLRQEHALMVQWLQTGGQGKQALETARTLLAQRDDYIARRIGETLQEEEMAILFLGLAHNIEAKLTKDIVLIQPFGKKPGGMGEDA